LGWERPTESPSSVPKTPAAVVAQPPSRAKSESSSIRSELLFITEYLPYADSNQLGRLAEVSTGGGAPNGYSDEGFCYDVVGNPTDVYSWILNTIWAHAIETYFPTGIPQTLAIGNQPKITYTLDSMARILTATASSGQNPLASVLYNAAGLPTEVDFGSGDSSTYGWKNGVGPMGSATFNVGSGSATNTLTWNANGTLQKLVTTDTLNSADAQTCTYSYDDFQRILTTIVARRRGTKLLVMAQTHSETSRRPGIREALGHRATPGQQSLSVGRHNLRR
jgi:hypothetical protein